MQFGWTAQSQSDQQEDEQLQYQQVLHPMYAQRALFYHFQICSYHSIGGLKMALSILLTPRQTVALMQLRTRLS